MVKIYVEELDGEYYCLDEQEMKQIEFFYQLHDFQIKELNERIDNIKTTYKELKQRLDEYATRQKDRDEKDKKRRKA